MDTLKKEDLSNMTTAELLTFNRYVFGHESQEKLEKLTHDQLKQIAESVFDTIYPTS